MSTEKKNYLGISKRDISQELFHFLKTDYGFPNAICRSLVNDFQMFNDMYSTSKILDGQLLYRAVSSNVSHGTPVDDMKLNTIRLTLMSKDDIKAAIKSQDELLKNRIVRLANEALDQGVYLTQADLSIILGESIKTISRHCKQLKDEDIIVPTRGNRMDIGPGTSHKTKIVEMYLKGYEFTDIKRNTRHSSESIMRYLNEFSRCAILYNEKYSLNQIRIITEHSERLVKEYVELYKQMKCNKECKDRLVELLNNVKGKKMVYAQQEQEGE